MTTIGFNLITPFKEPAVMAEFDASQANASANLVPHHVVMIGSRLATGSVAELQKTLVTKESQGVEFYGEGSQLAMMVERYLQINSGVRITCVAQDDDAGGSAAAGKFTITGTATEDGQIYAYVHGRRITASVSNTDTAAVVGPKLEAAINAEYNLAVTAADTAGDVDVTCRNDGTFGNSIHLATNLNSGEATPAGLTVTVVAMAGGTVDPDVQDALDVLGDTWYTQFVIGFDGTTPQMNKLQTDLTDRFGPQRSIDATAFWAARSTHANLITQYTNLNHEHNVVMGLPDGNGSYETPWEYCAQYAARVMQRVQVSPSRPYTNMPMSNLTAPVDDSLLFDWNERNLLLEDGVSTYRETGGSLRLSRIVTLYKTSPGGQPDIAYQQVETKYQLQAIRHDFRTAFINKFGAVSIVDDGNRPSAGSFVVSPSIIAAFVIERAEYWRREGWIQNVDFLADNLQVVRNGTDRVDILMTPHLVNQLFGVAARFEFRLAIPVSEAA